MIGGWLEYSSLIGQNLVTEELVTVAKIEFLESHLPYHSAVFHYIVLVYLQVPAAATGSRDRNQWHKNTLRKYFSFRIRPTFMTCHLFSTLP